MKNLEKTVVAKYLRVSTEEQVAHGYGLKVQKEKIEKYFELKDYPPNNDLVYIDEGYSGALPVEDRPALKRLVEDAKKGLFDKVVVYKIDRWGRKLLVIMDTLEQLNEAGVAF